MAFSVNDVTEIDDFWSTITNFIDLTFFIDMIVIFNTAIYDEEGIIIDKRGNLACNYLKGWFTIDLVSIFPFEIVMELTTSNAMSAVRLARLGRMMKMIKLMKLSRVLKLLKNQEQFSENIGQYLHIGKNTMRLFFLIISTFIVFNLIACMWIFSAAFQCGAHGDEGEDGL